MSTPNATAFSELMTVITERRVNPTDRSYTTSLYRGGVSKIGAKIKEEADEVVEAADETMGAAVKDRVTGADHLVSETADLLYHLFVLLAHCEVTLEQVEDELRSRFGVSGLDEKAARSRRADPDGKDIG